MIYGFARRFWRSEAGQDTIEYTLLAGFVGFAAAAAFPVISDGIRVLFTALSQQLSQAATGAHQ